MKLERALEAYGLKPAVAPAADAQYRAIVNWEALKRSCYAGGRAMGKSQSFLHNWALYGRAAGQS